MEPLPAGVRQPPRPPRPPAPPTTGGWGSGFYSGGSDGRPSLTLSDPRRSGPRQFLHEVVVEFHKVAWPTRDEVTHNALLCVAFLVLLTGLLAGLDISFGSLLRSVTVGG